MKATSVQQPPTGHRGWSTLRSLALPLGLVALLAFVVWAQTSAHYQRRIEALRYWWDEGSDESTSLSTKYGPDRFSRDLEEWIIRDYFQDKRNGVFLDVGANHYRDESNTYYLETVLGWSGVAVEALAEFGPDYAAHRPRTKFAAMFASDVDGERVDFFVPNEQQSKLVASQTPEMSARQGFSTTKTQVPTTTLNTVLDQAGVTKIDFLSMDIELSEPKALSGFDIDRFHPSLVCIEAHPDIRQTLLDYFHRHGYVVIGKYLRVDVRNLYFRPAS